MSAKREGIQQELFGATEVDASRDLNDADVNTTAEMIDTAEKLEVVENRENILVVQETTLEVQAKDTKSGFTFEQGIGRLEQIIGSLEQKDIPLEDALAFFREGVELVQECNRMLDQAETQMQILLEGPDGELRLEKHAEGMKPEYVR